MTLSADKDHAESRAIIKETTFLVGAKYLAQVLLLIRGFLIARVLGPGLYGIWTLIRTLIFAQDYLDLGVMEGMSREYPVAKAEGRDKDAFRIHQTALWWNWFSGIILGGIVFIAAWFPAVRTYRGDFIILAFVLPFNIIYLFLFKKFKAEQKAVLLSKCIYAYAVFNTLFGVGLLFIYQIRGLLAGMLITQGAIAAWLVGKRHLSLQYVFDGKTAMGLLRVGFPILLSTVSFYLMLNADKFIVFVMLGATSTGYYGLASFLVQSINYIPGSISTVIFPRIMGTFGETSDRQSVLKYFVTPLKVLAVVVPALLGLLYINIDLLINYVLPQYVPAINLLRIMMFGLFFSTLWVVPMNILIAFKKQKQLMYFNLVLLGVGVALDIMLIKMGFGILGVGVASVVIFFLLSLGCNIYTLYCFKKTGLQILFAMKDIYTPLFYFAGLLIILTNLKFDMPVILYHIVATAIYVVFSLPVVFALNRATGFWGHIVSLKKRDG